MEATALEQCHNVALTKVEMKWGRLSLFSLGFVGWLRPSAILFHLE